MPTALSDPSTTLYVILGVLVVIFGSVALRRQRRTDVYNLLIPAALLIALFAIDYMIESPREYIERTLGEMATASQNKKYDDVFKHVSDKFQYRSHDKKSLQEKARWADSIPNWEGIVVLDATRSRFSQKDQDTAEQVFDVKPLRLPGDEHRYECVGTFKKEGDQWRLIGCQFFRTRVENGKRVRGEEVTPQGL